jgi:nucleotide-binding universal stress UspA family protein
MTEQHKKVSLIGEAEVIALATDGSSFTDGAVQEAIFLAQECGAKLIVLNVIGIDSESAMGVHASSMAMREEILTYLETIKKMADDHEVACEIVLEESYLPDKAIVDLAYKHNADLLIMGRHGRRGLLKLLVGSMTSKVIGYKFPRVMVVPKDFSVGGERVLLATDGSEASEAAADETISMGVHCSNLKEVYVVSVINTEEGLDQAMDLVKGLCQRGKETVPHVNFHPLALVGRAAEVIASTALEQKVDMIVVGGHGKGLSKLLMGHVTEKVIGRAHCAVLVIEKKSAEEEA